MYFQRATNSVQRNVPSVQTQIAISNQQFLSPVGKHSSAQSQGKSIQETPNGNFVKEQLDSLFINLKKENQVLKEKLSLISSQVEDAEQKLQLYKKV
ncbi:unnamed protein product (macronuclear) [Paramecium tetraurelia]|uniref:Uncharacterized protein n=1 Tax=Paramecium tetraurelia TaxID=5888 RepID=A0BJ80_PARTE|nr:uncharacterized protein GSPATT00004970001 [Paramecium tetraurelia]CAK58597.1 unnamed protein product [Paramecium tetraurelia]|eukprot:XP_001425995.1 hypothetical protein (macronuclear) [Paramecium tetraurelia strain d4-2]